MIVKREVSLSAGKLVAAIAGLASGLAFLVVAGLILYQIELVGQGLLLGVAAVQSSVFAVGVAGRMMHDIGEEGSVRHLPGGIVVGFLFLLCSAAGFRALDQWHDQGMLQGVAIAVTAVVTVQFVRFAGGRRFR